jgi:Cu/Ag efflux pump CusA
MQSSLDPKVPQMRDRNLLVQWLSVPGTSLTEMDRIIGDAGRSLRSVPGVRNVASHVGQAVAGDQVVDVDSGQTWIVLDPKADYDKTYAAIRKTIASYPGLEHELMTYSGQSLDAAQKDNGRDITVRLYGSEQKILDTEVLRIRDWLSKMPGIVDPQVETSHSLEPVVQIAADVGRAARYGLKPGDVRRQAAVQMGGIAVASYYDNQQIFDVTVWSEPKVRRNLTDVQNLLLDTPDGKQVPLKDVAAVSVQPALTEIHHDMVARYIDVKADIAGADRSAVLKSVQGQLYSFALPLGYRADVFSDAQQRQDSNMTVLLWTLAAAFGVFLVLQAAFRRWRLSALVFLTLPLSVAGGVVSALITGRLLTLGALLGFVVVLCISVRNAISLVQRFQRLEASGTDTPKADLAFRGTREAAFPVLLTAVATALAAAPFVALGNVEGMEILRPMAVVVLGGLVTTTLFTLFVLPAVYVSLGGLTAIATWDLGIEGDAR